ncbi:MAG: glycosyltransferase, partial [Patescibacteria group bacterium]|nr:glycosyltransferase [Patescibacteria group bacterium]
IQAGLKVFTKEVFQTVGVVPRGGWVFDLEFLYRARHAGFVIENAPITFEKRNNGKSKVSFLKTSLEIGTNALGVRLKPLTPQHIPAKDTNTMQGAGVGYKRKKYVTHTTLHHSHSALQTFVLKQRIFIALLVLCIGIGLLRQPLFTMQIAVGILSFVYFIDVDFNLYLILKSLYIPQEIAVTNDELASVSDTQLPVYSILCPLYKEAHIIPHFLKSIDKLEYPKNKLDVMLLLEVDDTDSIKAVSDMQLPTYVRTVIVPHSNPKTKPKACNFGLSQAKGEYLVIYDAEDMPDPLQLKKAICAFKKSDKNVICLQAKLNYYNPRQNLLTRFFTAEYSLWFDITLTGLQAVNTCIPLGGTSNHFRTNDLKQLQGWDPFNVTEDADLGIRLFKKGYKTAIIDSVTFEEANSNIGNWIRQR